MGFNYKIESISKEQRKVLGFLLTLGYLVFRFSAALLLWNFIMTQAFELPKLGVIDFFGICVMVQLIVPRWFRKS